MEEILESRVGKLFIIAYALFAIGTYVYAFSCGGDTCSLYIVLPILPWAYILAADLGVSFPWAVYPVFILLNASVVYVLGAFIEWAYNRYQDRKEVAKLHAIEGN